MPLYPIMCPWLYYIFPYLTEPHQTEKVSIILCFQVFIIIQFSGHPNGPQGGCHESSTVYYIFPYLTESHQTEKVSIFLCFQVFKIIQFSGHPSGPQGGVMSSWLYITSSHTSLNHTRQKKYQLYYVFKFSNLFNLVDTLVAPAPLYPTSSSY